MPDKLVMTRHLGEPPDGVPVEIFQRTQMVMVGAVMVPMVSEHYYVLGAPADWPKVQIRARRRLGRWLYRRGRRKGIMLDDERFNALFRVSSKDEPFALLLLNPTLQSFIADKPDVDWSAGRGAIKLWYRGKLNKHKIGRALERLATFEGLIAPELFNEPSP